MPFVGQPIVSPVPNLTAASSGTTYNDSGSGTLALTGSGSQSYSHTATAAGTITFTGTGSQTYSHTATAAGTITFSGTGVENYQPPSVGTTRTLPLLGVG